MRNGPDHKSDFVELEDHDGMSMHPSGAGVEWRLRDDLLWELGPFAGEERQNGIHIHATELAVSSILGMIDQKIEQCNGAVRDTLKTLRREVKNWHVDHK